MVELETGMIFKNVNNGAPGAVSKNGCGPFLATPIFLKLET